LHLADQRPRDAVWSLKHHQVGQTSFALRERATYRREDRFVLALAVVPRHLEHDRQSFASVARERERRGVARPQARMTAFRGEFEILRVIIAPAKDDEILEPSGDEQPSVVHAAP